MKGDLVIKDVDLGQLEDDLIRLEEVYEGFKLEDTNFAVPTEKAGVRVLGMLKTWAEGRKAEKEDEELAESLATNIIMDNAKEPIEIKDIVLYALKAQRKRLGK